MEGINKYSRPHSPISSSHSDVKKNKISTDKDAPFAYAKQEAGEGRIPFLSAHSILASKERQQLQPTYSYAGLGEILQAFNQTVRKGLTEFNAKHPLPSSTTPNINQNKIDPIDERHSLAHTQQEINETELSQEKKTIYKHAILEIHQEIKTTVSDLISKHPPLSEKLSTLTENFWALAVVECHTVSGTLDSLKASLPMQCMDEINNLLQEHAINDQEIIQFKTTLIAQVTELIMLYKYMSTPRIEYALNQSK